MIPASIRRTAARAMDRLLARAVPSFDVTRQARELYRDHEARCAAYPAPAPPSPRRASILEGVRRYGYYVIPGYWSREKCAAAVREVDRILREYPEAVQGAPKSDFRIFGANNVSDLLGEFGGDPLLVEVAGLHNRMPTRLGMTLAARLPYAEGSLGSGEGGHRGQFFVSAKAMLYLTDVGLDNGPLQMVRDSWTLPDVCRDIRQARL